MGILAAGEFGWECLIAAPIFIAIWWWLASSDAKQGIKKTWFGQVTCICPTCGRPRPRETLSGRLTDKYLGDEKFRCSDCGNVYRAPKEKPSRESLKPEKTLEEQFPGAHPSEIALLRMLKSAERDDRLAAIRLASNIETPKKELVDAVARLTVEDASRSVRLAASRFFKAWMGEIVHNFVEKLKSEDKREGDMAAVFFLSTIGPSILEDLQPLLESENLVVRKRALHVLALMQDGEPPTEA